MTNQPWAALDDSVLNYYRPPGDVECAIPFYSGLRTRQIIVAELRKQHGVQELSFLRDVVFQRTKNTLRAVHLRSKVLGDGTTVRGGQVGEATAFRGQCKLCCRLDSPHTLIGRVQPTFGGTLRQSEYRLIHCHACDVVYLDPFPPRGDLELLYQGTVQFDDARFEVDAKRITNSYARRIDYLKLLAVDHSSVLEVGAGLAWICRVAKARDPAALTVAQDVSGECVASCPWVDEYVVGALDAVPGNRQFHLVSLTHVLEHLLEPRAILAQVSAYVSDGGHIYITAPFRPPFWKTSHGIHPWLHYEYLHVPAHIAYLSERWMRETAAQIGFTLVHWDQSHDGHQVFEAVLRKSAKWGSDPQ